MTKEKTNTTGQGESTAPVVAEPKVATLQEKLDTYYVMTGLKLDPNCHMDMEFLSSWYETKYLTKVVYRWAMKPEACIVHYVDGVVYKSANMTDEIAERLMRENPAYAECFVEINKKEV
jgi:hypothetical protein